MAFEDRFTAIANFGPEHYPSVILLRGDGWVCLDYIGPDAVKPKPNAVLSFPDMAIARQFLPQQNTCGKGTLITASFCKLSRQ